MSYDHDFIFILQMNKDDCFGSSNNEFEVDDLESKKVNLKDDDVIEVEKSASNSKIKKKTLKAKVQAVSCVELNQDFPMYVCGSDVLDLIKDVINLLCIL